MAALVANYGSSSESDSEEETQANEAKATTAHSAGVNLLTCTHTESEDEDSESETESKAKLKLTTQKPVRTHAKPSSEENSKLPLPSFIAQDTTTKSGNSLQSSSVFSNPFEKARQQKLSILEQHVKLSSAEKTEAEMGKKICWMYRKGRCRFGHKCKYAHDNDIALKQTAQQESDEGTHFASGEQYFHEGQGQGQFGQNSQYGQYDISPDFGVQDNDEVQQQRKRKKPGLAQGMVPPKKSMSAFQRQAAQERPWTVKNNQR